MDEQLEKQEIKLKVTDEIKESVPESITSAPAKTPALKTSNFRKSESSKLVSRTSELTEETRYSLRNWPEAILTFVMLNSYVAIIMQFSMVIASGGMEAWWDLVKFNFLELAGLFFIGGAHLQSVLQQTGQLQVFFITSVIYWSFFLIYPIFILTDKSNDFDEEKNKKSRLRDVAIALVSLSLFIPFPLLSFWRFGGMIRFLGITPTSIYDERGEALKKTMEEASFRQILPEVICVAAEAVLNRVVTYNLFILCAVGPIRIPMSDFVRLFLTYLGIELFVTLLYSLQRKSLLKHFSDRDNVGEMLPVVTGAALLCIVIGFGHTMNSMSTFVSWAVVLVGVLSMCIRFFRKSSTSPEQ
ncbi:MAG: hypothetical protein K2X93_24645 [Candidatus Obscuribacterales bacterium]|nr:hypothetical protein [Candidatus Obscuribacterales bacterium]